ncbi:MAG: hypothetical protein MUP55_02445 [Candidatus Aenigmarchaeota archaeon]|nr:hypothetical protein [Candidatus Aenigmarchaeota archaeon]
MGKFSREGIETLERLGIKTKGQAYQFIMDSIEDDEDDDEEECSDLRVMLASVVKRFCVQRLKSKAKLKKLRISKENIDNAGLVLYQVLMDDISSHYGKNNKLMKAMKSQMGKEVA